MIGLIGPADSVAHALSVANANQWDGRFVARSYRQVEEAVTLAAELDQTCQVLLFTGRVPFELNKGLTLNAELQYISHSGADLYRAIAQVLLTHGGTMPTASVDSIDAETATGTFDDLMLPIPATAPLPRGGEGPLPAVDEFVRFHLDSLSSGAVEIALTCLAEVNEHLSAHGVPVQRIVHTTATLRAAMRHAVLADELHRTRSAQPAVALYRIDVDAKAGLDVYDREQRRLRAQSVLLRLARKNGGRLSTLERDLYAITTNRGAIEMALERRRTGHSSLLDVPAFGAPARVGVGIGETYSLAEENARSAMRVREGAVTVMFPDGRTDSGHGASADHFGAQDVTDGYVQLGERLQIGALAAQRLVRALGKVDPEGVTARELGEAYGVQTRSARRLLSTLIDAGFAEEIGIRARPQAGRPQTLYRVNVSRVLEELNQSASTVS